MSAAAERNAIRQRHAKQTNLAPLLQSHCPGHCTDVAVANRRLYGKGSAVKAEVARVKATGGWVSDGRVCDILAVSRAFGDRQFKGDGLEQLVARGIE